MRSVGKTEQLCYEDTARTGATVATCKRNETIGYVGATSPPTRTGYDAITFQHGIAMVEHEALDGFCAFGEVPVIRVDGGFQGGVISEAVTSLDLGTEEIKFHQDAAA